MPFIPSSRRKFDRFFLKNSVFVLKSMDTIRMGPMIDIGMGGCSFNLLNLSGQKVVNLLNKSILSIRLEDILMDNFSFKIAHVTKNNKAVTYNSDFPQEYIGLQFIDFKYDKIIQNMEGHPNLNKIEDRREHSERRTGWNRRRCDLPQYQSGFRAGRDRRSSENRRKGVNG